ncbi:MarR family winged helix-turn-helix transcriptional regulator [Methylobacterium nodulans]|uniref:Transcriptional regulator, MarR family n=1 Tax=Methylobacterium nodulans (strain LMG 21967 / CNCM I-2342 / ORS 2060) TaxID=460265 RepID=B8IQ68_METNO|nr:MarR family transcriptional regulator [Methylobacterium nodulans]ACL58568.1 transcriptional regulator, MarR family [Methylobacterium nodulans ORS 2060]
MSSASRAAEAVTRLILDVFRANGALLAAGDRLVADLGLTSARWQVLGAVAMAEAPLSVAGIARAMGLTRQAVQRVADDLERAGHVRFAPNPHHQRSKLVLLTPQGEAAYRAAAERQGPWAEALAQDLDPAALALAAEVLRAVSRRLAETSPANQEAGS